MEVTKNVFRSLSMDLAVSETKNTQMLYNQNFRVLTRDNNNWVLTNIKGNELLAGVSPGFRPVCVKVYSGVAYIISAEIVNGAPTGTGEIGTFPSPDYDGSNEMEPVYHPLMNYMGDVENGLVQIMRSANFGFTLEKAFSMVVEEDYDGTVNVIWTDGVKPIRIVNSRFTLRDDNTYEIIDRTGIKDTNLYEARDFDTIINLISKVSSLMNIKFNGLLLGGKMLSGNYRYYFKLETEDGNQTNVLGESGLVSVFFGDSPANTKGGGSVQNETDKLVSFEIENIDTSYRYLRVYFIYSSGQEEPVESAYIIDQKYPIENGRVVFSHIGSEKNIGIDASILNIESQPVDTVGTICNAGGYILAGDITEKTIDYNSLISFAQKIRLTPVTKKLDTYGKTNNGSDLFGKNILSSEIGGTDGYNNGYCNPMNIYHKLGYGSGESNLFGVRFILPGGDVTQTFPVMGADMMNGNTAYPDEGSLDALISSLNTLHQGFNETGGFNLKGVLRFPNRPFSFERTHLLVDGVSFYETRLLVNGVRFLIPQIPAELKAITIGIQFMKGESNPDRITQGVFFNTMPVPVDDYIMKGESSARTGWKLYDYSPGFSENTAKWIPAYNYRLESPATWEDYDGGARKEDIRLTGIVPVRFNLYNRAAGRETKFAFISPEIQSIPSKMIGRINNRDIKVVKRSRVTSLLDCPSKCYNNNTTYSLIRNISNAVLTGSHDARSSWAVGGDDGKNNDHFSGGSNFQAKTADREYTEFSLDFNDFVGIILTDGQQALGVPNNPGFHAGQAEYINNVEENHSVLADIYGINGQRTTADLKRIYSNITSVRYFPISQRFYWSEENENSIPELSLESLIGSARSIDLFGGDTFVGPTYRRLYKNAYGTYGMENFREQEGEANTGPSMMYFAESTVNSAIRGEHTFDVSEYRMRSFYPYEAGKKAFNQGDVFGKGNPWREYRLPETSDYNHGHRNLDYGRFSISFPVDAPYIATRRRARVMHSGKFTGNSFSNEYRRWEGLNFQDYDSSLGRIIRLGQIGDKVLIVQERGTSYIRLEERIASGNSTGGPVFFASSGVLPPKEGFLSKMGTLWPESVIFTDIGAYGFDHESQYIWKFDYTMVKPISKLSIDSYLNKHLKGLKDSKYRPLGTFNVIATRDSDNEDVLFGFKQPEMDFTVSYSEVVQDFNMILPRVCDLGFSLVRDYYTIKNGNFYLHDSDNVPRGFFYGQQEKFKISFVVNEQVDLNKVFALLDIMSNHVFPDKITYRVPGAKSVEDIVHLGKIYDVNAKFLENKIAVSIPKIKEVTDNDATEYGLATESNNLSSADINSRIRGHLMVVDLEYSNTKSIVIKSVLTYFNYC